MSMHNWQRIFARHSPQQSHTSTLFVSSNEMSAIKDALIFGVTLSLQDRGVKLKLDLDHIKHFKNRGGPTSVTLSKGGLWCHPQKNFEILHWILCILIQS